MRSHLVLLLVGLLLTFVLPAFAQNGDPLAGTHWQLVSIGETAVVEGTSVTLVFADDGSAGGSGGCNTYGASYSVEGGTIAFGDVFSTLMACAEDYMAQEQAYFAALQSATTYTLSADLLVITYGEGETLVFEALTQLPGTMWQLETLAGEDVSGIITLNFDLENGVHGSAGCNSYGGTVVADGAAIGFGELVSTLMACADEQVAAQEQAYLAALQAAVSYVLTDEQLIIRYADEAGSREELIFVRVHSLANSAWQLETLAGAAVLGEVPVTLQFDDAGLATGSGGCNQYSSRYSMTAGSITFDAVVSTRMACAEGIMAQERAYFAALEAATSFELNEEQLIIDFADGQRLVFTPALTVSTTP